MDLRAVRTRTNIYNAFLALRAKKPLEKITVKELSQAAMINKATFYLHYQDIYDLSNQLEDQAIDQLFQGIPHPEDLLLHPAEGFLVLLGRERLLLLTAALLRGGRRRCLRGKL